jgi:superfamily I DNA and/or RNA helicase
MLRLNHPSRPLDEAPLEIQPYCAFSPDSLNFGVPSLQEVLKFRVVVTSIFDASLLSHYHLCNSSLQTLAQTTLNTIYPRHPDVQQFLIRPHWSHLLIDEAAQSTEPDTLIPLSAVLPFSNNNLKAVEPPQVVLVGDIQQLGPVVLSEYSRLHDFDCSLLDRLSKRPIYADHPDARKHMRERSDLDRPPSQFDVPFCNLRRNYRSHTAILAPPSMSFYEDTLLPCVSEDVLQSKLCTWPDLPRPGFPLAFIACEGLEKWVDEGVSFYNEEQIDEVVKTIKSLKAHSHAIKTPLHPSQISVITPFREQVWRIRLALRAVDLHEVDVGNVEALQGAEK